MIASILFLACSPDAAFSDADAAYDDVTAEASALAGRVSIPVDVTDETATSVAITHVTWADDAMTVGAELTSGSVVDGVATLSIPARVPFRDRSSNKPLAPVYYAVTVRDTDGDYVAVSDSALIFAPRAVEGGPSRGWNVLVDPTDTEQTWASAASGMEASHSLVGSDTLDIGGLVDVEYGVGQRIVTAPLGSATGAAPYDEPFQVSWHISLSGVPSANLVGGYGEDAGIAAFEPMLYQDIDASLSYSDVDPVQAHVCIGPVTAGMAWVPAPRTVGEAMSYAEKGSVSGWTMFDLGAEGFSSVEAEGNDAALRESCMSDDQ